MAAIQFDTRLGELGGQRMLKRGVGDDRDEAGAFYISILWIPCLFGLGLLVVLPGLLKVLFFRRVGLFW